MANFSPPAGTDYYVQTTRFGRVVTFASGFATDTVSVTTPAVPGSGTAATNTTGVNVFAYLSGGTISSVTVGGGTIVSSAAAGQALCIGVPSLQTIAVTYTSAPTWVWKAA